MSYDVSAQARSLRVAFLVGHDIRETREPIEVVCALPGVVACAILLDTQKSRLRQRLRRLRRNVRRNGWIYILHSFFHTFRVHTDRLVERAMLRPGEVAGVLREAFPQRSFTLRDIGARVGAAVREIGDLNEPAAAEALRQCGADLGIVLGTRILKPATFTAPRLGCINLHKGKVPDYRGIPPGIWELYDGAPVAGVTVHFVDTRVDAGDVLETGEIAICPLETPDTLAEKLHHEGIRVLVRAVTGILDGTAVRTPQPPSSIPPRTTPTFLEMATLRRQLPHWRKPSPSNVVLHNLFWLAVFYSGLNSLLRKRRNISVLVLGAPRQLSDAETEAVVTRLLVLSASHNALTRAAIVQYVRRATLLTTTVEPIQTLEQTQRERE
jgi:hypothetical protein